MEKLDPKTDGSTVDIVQQNLDKMKELFPGVFTEGKVDFEALRETLGDTSTTDQSDTASPGTARAVPAVSPRLRRPAHCDLVQRSR